jgi:uncharacterized protein
MKRRARELRPGSSTQEPDMQCPRCETSSLDERDRDGVTIDVCKACRGVWLDRGELEKLIARTTAEFDEYERRPPPPSQPSQPQAQPQAHYRGDDDHRRHRGDDDYRRKYPRKKSWVESLGDIFD